MKNLKQILVYILQDIGLMEAPDCIQDPFQMHKGYGIATLLALFVLGLLIAHLCTL